MFATKLAAPVKTLELTVAGITEGSYGARVTSKTPKRSPAASQATPCQLETFSPGQKTSMINTTTARSAPKTTVPATMAVMSCSSTAQTPLGQLGCANAMAASEATMVTSNTATRVGMVRKCHQPPSKGIPNCSNASLKCIWRKERLCSSEARMGFVAYKVRRVWNALEPAIFAIRATPYHLSTFSDTIKETQTVIIKEFLKNDLRTRERKTWQSSIPPRSTRGM